MLNATKRLNNTAIWPFFLSTELIFCYTKNIITKLIPIITEGFAIGNGSRRCLELVIVIWEFVIVLRNQYENGLVSNDLLGIFLPFLFSTGDAIPNAIIEMKAIG